MSLSSSALRPILHGARTWGSKQRKALERIRAGEAQNGKALAKLLALTSARTNSHASDFSAELFDDAFVAVDPLWWTETLPHVAGLALRSEELFRGAESPLAYLPPNVRGSVRLSRIHVASILALAFFDAIPPADPKVEEEWGLPERLSFQLWLMDSYGTEANKALCLLHYFVAARATFASGAGDEDVAATAGGADEAAADDDDAVVISRLVLHAPPDAAAGEPRRTPKREKEGIEALWAPWLECEAPLTDLVVVESGGIEDAAGALQADFANEYIGGGVLHGGNVQEEIRFSICPECLVSLLICPPMRPREAILLQGIRQYASYEGYGHRFECSGAHAGTGQPEHIICLDALNYAYGVGDVAAQYSARPSGMLRELTKLRAALSADGGIASVEQAPRDAPRPLATGNWGCGVFGGDARLKALLQWLEASRAGRRVIYYPFGDPKASGLKEAAQLLLGKRATVAQLARALLESQGEHMSHGRAFAAMERHFGR